MNKVLVSACLLGDPVRYDASHKALGDARLRRWREEGRLVPICPEVAGGLPTPRPPAEIQGGQGRQVLHGQARIADDAGDDLTEAFIRGAKLALSAARRHGVRLALLIDRSPSCGSTQIYDGHFEGTLVAGEGVTTALLRASGIEVFAPHQLDALGERLAQLDADEAF
ncbi:DUF523 domain-containing protein [Halomonas cupida]|uniref:DUF523 domain-containing protein n=1 Tax=Halomonas cupida TaxID=44933 RepID=UPI003EF6B882